MPAWLPDLYDRHGTPLPSFYAPLAYGVVELLRALSAGPETAFRLAYLGFWMLGAIGAALAARLHFGKGAASASAAAFALAPYTLVDIYVRAGLAEFAALSLLPWGLAALAGRRLVAFAGTAAVLALLVWTHNITALLAFPALAFVALASPGEKRSAGLLGLAFGLALSISFWLPALLENRWLWSQPVLTSGFFDFRRHFVDPLNLLPGRSALQFTVGPATGIDFRFGELLLLGVAVAWIGRVFRKRGDSDSALPLAAGASVALFMTSSWSEPLWVRLPLLSYVQFPFRFFLFASVFAAPLVGAMVVRAAPRWQPLLAAGAIAGLLLLARPWIVPRYAFVDRTSGQTVPVLSSELERARSDPRFLQVEQWVTLDRLRTAHWSGSAGEAFLPRTVTQPPLAPRGEVLAATAESLDSGVQVVGGSWGYPTLEAQIDVTEPGRVALHQFWFPGWSVTVDGRPREISAEADSGRIVVAVRPGEKRIFARFGTTPLRRGALYLSVAALAGFVLAIRRMAREARVAARSR